MRERELVDTLQRLGLERLDYRLVQLMPLVRVAWADGSVHPEEAARIRQLAHAARLTSESQLRVVDRWLQQPLSAQDHDGGIRLLVGLAWYYDGIDPEFDTSLVTRVMEQCEELATLCGGFLGFGRVSARERAVLDALYRDIEQHNVGAARHVPGPGWTTLREEREP